LKCLSFWYPINATACPPRISVEPELQSVVYTPVGLALKWGNLLSDEGGRRDNIHKEVFERLANQEPHRDGAVLVYLQLNCAYVAPDSIFTRCLIRLIHRSVIASGLFPEEENKKDTQGSFEQRTLKAHTRQSGPQLPPFAQRKGLQPPDSAAELAVANPWLTTNCPAGGMYPPSHALDPGQTEPCPQSRISSGESVALVVNWPHSLSDAATATANA